MSRDSYSSKDMRSALEHARDTMMALVRGQAVRDLDEQISWINLLLSTPSGPSGAVERKAKLVDDMERIGLYPVNEPSLTEWAEREIRKHDSDAERLAVTPATARPNDDAMARSIRAQIEGGVDERKD